MQNLKSHGIKYLLTKLKGWMEETFTLLEDAVLSVNGNIPDDNGNVQIEQVDLANNLITEFRQNNTGAFIQRTSGGSSAIVNGQARLVSVLGNIVRSGYLEPIVEMVVSPASSDEPITATINKETFINALDDREQAVVITLNFTSAWSEEPADYGITVNGDPVNGDQISVTFTPEVRGTIESATPGNFVSTGYNLYDPSNEYAKVVKYSDVYGYRIAGSYSSLAFSTTPSGETTTITPSNGLFQIPSDGYVIVTGGNAESTEIYPTWSDWENGHPGGFEEYSASVINLSDVMTSYFPYGLCAVGTVRDEINLGNGRAIRRIDRVEYNETNLAQAKASGRGYIYDDDFIYVVLSSPVNSSISVSGVFTVNDHGVEYFTDTSIPAVAQATYSMNLKNKLERDTVTISQQTLQEDQKEQIRQNIGAAGAAELANKLDNNAPLFFWKAYSTTSTISVNSNAEKTLTIANFGVTPISGYTPMGIFAFTSGKSGLLVRRIDRVNDASSTAGLMVVRNVTGSTISSVTPSITVLYIKSEFVTTAPEQS